MTGSLTGVANAAPVTHLATQTATATGDGATGTPRIATFNIPSGKNRVLFIWAAFERDHCSPTDDTNGLCNISTANTTGTGLGDNWPEPRVGTPPTTTTNNQITAQLVGPGGSINKKNALTIGGTPSGDTRFFINSSRPSSAPASAALYSLGSFHILLSEDEINTLLGGAASGTVSITLPDVNNPSNTGDDAILIASVYQNVEQTAWGMVRNATASAQLTVAGPPTYTPGNYSMAITAYDASPGGGAPAQTPDEADDGKLIIGLSSTTEGFVTPTGHVSLATSSIANNNGTFDTPSTLSASYATNEPSGISAGAFFRNGGATPGSLATLTSAASASTQVYGGLLTSFLLESDNADTSDAPISYGSPTHTIANGVRIGATVDADAGLLNSSNANGDDTNTTDDEDGVTIPTLTQGQSATISVNVNQVTAGTGRLQGWIDWNGDGDFADVGEQIATNLQLSTGTSGTIAVPITVPANAVTSAPTFARFRWSTNASLNSTNTATDGEVEDYQVAITPPPPDLILSKTHTGNFTVGTPASYTLTVNNIGSTATTGAITVTDTFPTGLTIPNGTVTLSGTNAANWTCTASNNVITCTSTTAIAASGSSTFDLTGIQVSAAAAPSVTNTASVSGGGQTNTSNDSASDPTTVQVAPSTFTISGTVFEDVNYGGGSGRPLSTSGTTLRGGATVELYNKSNGAFVASTTTSTAVATLGQYSFSNVAAGDYYVRVVNRTVTSSRPGYVAGLLPVQTFRVDNSTGTPSNDGNRVGGENPAMIDTGAAATGAVLNTTNFTFTTGAGSATTGGQSQSIAPVKVGSNNVTGIDFGFNFDTIVNTNNTGQGSLRQFIINANALSNTGLDQVSNSAPAISTTAIDPAPGVETSIFMIPSSQLTSGVAIISPTTLLPAFTDTYTTLDGRTQTINMGDSNSGLLGVGGTVGTGADGRAGTGDEPTLSKVAAPEIEIRDGNNLSTGLELQANYVTVKGIAIHGFGATQAAGQGDIYVVGVNNINISQNMIGARATSFTNPVAAERTGGSGVWVTNGAQATISNNLIGYTGYNGIACTNQSLTSTANISITNNEFRGNAAVNTISNAVELFWNGANPTITIQGNLLANTVNQGAIHFQNNLGGTGATLNIDNNTITNTNSTLTYTQAIILNLIQDAVVSHNIIESTNNSTLGVGIGIQTFPVNGSPGNIPARRNRVTQNAIYDTLKGPGIDLWTQGQSGATPRITANDGLKNANQANVGMDYPIITSSVLTSGTLRVKGFVGNTPTGSPTFANATLEFFIADDTPADQNGEVIVGDGKSLPHGEGRTYIGTCLTDSNSQFDCSFSDAGTIGLTDAQNITATATDEEGNTSEFSSVPTASNPNVLLVKRITAINGNRVKNPNDNTPLDITVDDATLGPLNDTPSDTDLNWPLPTSGIPAISTFLKGAVDAGQLNPGDTIEYTIYFLNTGGTDAKNVKICDRILGNQLFLPAAYGASNDIQLQIGNGSITELTQSDDPVDRGAWFPSTTPPGNCNLQPLPVGAIDNGAIAVQITGTGNAGQPDFPGVSSATAPGSPSSSYGFIRFTTKVK
jgi:uncharacterized repeat protein (TIGR01451 family)